MTLTNKILIGIVAMLLTSIGIFIIYKQIENSKKMDDIQHSIIDQKQLMDNITRSGSEFMSKEDFDKLLKAQDLNLKAIQKDIDALDAKITGIQTISVVSNGQTTTNVPTTTTTPTDNGQTPIDPATPDPYGYLKNTQHLSLDEKFGETNIPIGDVAFSASKEKPWSLILPQRSYKISNVLSTDSSGKTIAYTKFSITSDGKNYEVKLDENKVVSLYPSPSFSWFNPHLQLQMSGGVAVGKDGLKGEYTPGIGVSIASYGKTKAQPDLQFFSVGIGYGVVAKKIDFTLSPIQVNLNKILPVFKNTYLGPSVNVNTSGNFGVGVGLGINF